MATIEDLTFAVEPIDAGHWALKVAYRVRFFLYEDGAWFSETVRLWRDASSSGERAVIGALESSPFRFTMPPKAADPASHVVTRAVPPVRLKVVLSPGVSDGRKKKSRPASLTDGGTAVATQVEKQLAALEGVVVRPDDVLFVTAEIAPVLPEASSGTSSRLAQPFGGTAGVELGLP